MDTSLLSAEELRAFWRGHIEHWRASAQSQAAYCREHGLTGDRFRYWKRRFAPVSSAPGDAVAASVCTFLPIQVTTPLATGAVGDSGVTVRLPTGIGLELSTAFDADTLRAAVQALSA